MQGRGNAASNKYRDDNAARLALDRYYEIVERRLEPSHKSDFRFAANRLA